MNLSPRSAFWAPDRVRSSCARCRRAARAARAESRTGDAPTAPPAEVDAPARDGPWPHVNRLSSALRSSFSCRARATASAFSSWEKWRSRCDELRPMEGDRDTADPVASDKYPESAAGAGSTLRSTMVSSPWRSSVTSTNSTPSFDAEVPGDDIARPLGTVSDAHRRSWRFEPLIPSYLTVTRGRQRRALRSKPPGRGGRRIL
ncbi:hypothetical protein BHE74_00006733 [Ensete ventricosum]|uniref:Uncharacterized protein n=1 Tax=Ensete ventricosum TaxID=4639 RepID=A0A426XNK9_ENSVE|nr:hypothetical protein B296_00058071 [Ensete ventricosum]RWW84655.1 hypothetical protein BHE74_00006733 [Ensete ventricosum]RZR72158.1 hypothetical protein BHM03_00010820 [Ensete ventricosum]